MEYPNFPSYIGTSDVIVFNRSPPLFSRRPPQRATVRPQNHEANWTIAYVNKSKGKMLGHKARTAVKYDSATTRALAFRLSFISLISLSTSSINLGK